MSEPAFSLHKPYYDNASYSGRVLNFLTLIDPRGLFVRNRDIESSQGLIQAYKASGAGSAAELWKARHLLQATLHPDTEEKIFLPCRACAFVPMNVPIAAGMLLSAPTVSNAILWQWVNQSFNAGFNYANRPIAPGKADDSALRDTLVAYVSATGVSCAIAVGLGQFVKRASEGKWYAPGALRAISLAVPFTAVAGAGSFNVVAMRARELSDGISVFTPSTDGLGEDLGKSQAAARSALLQCVASRVVMPMPVLLFPPLVMPVVRGAFPKAAASRVGGAMLDLVVLTGFIAVAVPCALGLFPQQSSIAVTSLEPHLATKAKDKGCDTVVFNKGL